MLRKPSLQVALSVYMSFGLLAACAPGPNDMADSDSLRMTAGEGSVEARAQAALASFHEVDGSFSDTLQLASLANQTPQNQRETSVGTALYQAAVPNDTDANDSDDSELPDSKLMTSELKTASDLQPSSAKNLASPEAKRPGLFNELFQSLFSSEAQTEPAQAEPQIAAIDDNDADAPDEVNPDEVNPPPGELAERATLQAEPAQDKLVSFSPAASLAQMNKLASSMRATLMQKGHVRIAADGSFDVNDEALQSDLQAQQQENAVLNSLEDLNPGPGLSPVAPERLTRLGQNGIEALAAPLTPLTLDGRVLNRFAASYRGEGLERDVLISRPAGDNGFDAVLDERSDGFTRHAIRSAEPQADGSLRVITNLTVHLYTGERLDLFEERYVTASGNGVGHGSLRLLGVNGQGVSTGELRTLVNADGSLTTHLDLDEGEDLLLYEDASGRSGLASLALAQPTGRGIDLDTLMQAGLNQGADLSALAVSEPAPSAQDLADADDAELES